MTMAGTMLLLLLAAACIMQAQAAYGLVLGVKPELHSTVGMTPAAPWVSLHLEIPAVQTNAELPHGPSLHPTIRVWVAPYVL